MCCVSWCQSVDVNIVNLHRILRAKLLFMCMSADDITFLAFLLLSPSSNGRNDVSLENSRLIQSKIELWITQLLMPQERNQSHQSSWMDFFAYCEFFFFPSYTQIKLNSRHSFGFAHTPHTFGEKKFTTWSSKFDCAYDNVRSSFVDWMCFLCECGHNMLLNFSSPQQHKSHFFPRFFLPSRGAAVLEKNHQTPF